MTREQEPILVTTARQSPREELAARQRRYLITMGLRIACFILAIVLFSVGLRWVAAVAVAGSLVLPWVAVVVANAGPRRAMEQPALYQAEPPNEITAGRR